MRFAALRRAWIAAAVAAASSTVPIAAQTTGGGGGPDIHDGDQAPPLITVTPGGGAYGGSPAPSLAVTIQVCDDQSGPAAGSLSVLFRGVPVSFASTGAPSPAPACAGPQAWFQGTLPPLVPGDNVLEVTINDQALNPATGGATFTYTSDAVPTITFTPAPGASVRSAALHASVAFGDDQGLNHGSVVMTTEGAAGSCTYTPMNAQSGIGTCSLTLQAGGANRLRARITDGAGQTTEAVAEYAIDQTRPAVAIHPANGADFSDSLVAVTVDWSTPDALLDEDSRGIWLDGRDVTGQFSHVTLSTSTGHAQRSTATLGLAAGYHRLKGFIRDNSGDTAVTEAVIFRHLGPRMAPSFSAVQPHREDVRTPGAFEPGLSWSTPAVVWMDQPLSATLVYAQSQAAPSVYLPVDVDDYSDDPPARLSLRVFDASNAQVRFSNGQTESVYAADGGNGSHRLAAHWAVPELPTGAYRYRVEVTSHWADGAALTSSRWVRVLVVNERNSPFSPGWSLVGLHRLHLQGDTALVLTQGDGSARYFRKQACAAGASCSYTSPAGDFTTLSYVAAGGGNPAYYVRFYPDGSVMHYLADGRAWYSLHGKERRQFMSFTYDASGKMGLMAYGVDGVVKQQFSFTYHWNVVLGSITDPAGRVSNLGYGSRDGSIAGINVTEIRHPDGEQALVAYFDELGRLTHWHDRAQAHWRVGLGAGWEIDSLVTPTVSVQGQAVRPVVRVRSLSALTLAAGSSPAPRTVPSEAWVRMDGPGVDSLTWVPDRFGLPGRYRDGQGRVGTVLRNQHGQDTLHVTPHGDQYRYAWNGSKLEWSSGPGGTTTFTYGSFDQLAQMVGPGGSARQFINGQTGQVDSVSTDGYWLHYEYDGYGRIRTVKDGNRQLLGSYEYHPTGSMNISSVTTPAGTTHYAYDAAGRVTSRVDAGGRTTGFEYDAMNRPVGLTDPLQKRTQLGWSPGYLASVLDAAGQRYSFLPNGHGLDTMTVDPRGLISRMYYSASGQLEALTSRRGQRTDLRYDGQGRVTQHIAGADTTFFAYGELPAGADQWNEARSFTAVRNRFSVDTVFYDLRGLVVREKTVRNGRAYEVTSSYGGDGSRGTVQALAFDAGGYNRGLNVTYGDDEYGNLARITTHSLGGGTHETGVKVDPLVDQLRHVRLPTGDSIHFGFTPTPARLSHLGYSDPALHAELGAEMQYDALGRLTRMRHYGAGDARVYRYDAGGQLTGWGTVPAAGGDTTWTAAWAYDAVGNPAGSGVTVETGNRLRTIAGVMMEYDDEGNLRHKYDGGRMHQTFTWDAAGQLVTVVGTFDYGATWTTTHYRYDGLGRRIRKEVNGAVTEYVYDGSHIALELDGAGAVTARYAYWPGVDRPLSLTRGSQTYFYLADQQGNVRALVDQAGNVANRYRYDPWGEAVTAEEQVQQPFRYTGREYDPETRLYFYRARYYDPQLRRFVSEDPIGLVGGMNPYAYVGNDPVNATDPSGLCRLSGKGSVGFIYLSEEEIERLSAETRWGDTFHDRMKAMGCTVRVAWMGGSGETLTAGDILTTWTDMFGATRLEEVQAQQAAIRRMLFESNRAMCRAQTVNWPLGLDAVEDGNDLFAFALFMYELKDAKLAASALLSGAAPAVLARLSGVASSFFVGYKIGSGPVNEALCYIAPEALNH